MNAKAIADSIIGSFAEDRRPIRVFDVAVEILQEIGAGKATLDDSQELAERIVDRVKNRLRAHANKCAEEGRYCRYEFTLTGSLDYIQGSRRVRPTDSARLAEAKRLRKSLSEYRKFLTDLNFWEFEAACAGVLELLGCSTLTITRRANDQGIDFFGRLNLTGRLDVEFHIPGPDRRFTAWVVGQAKHYSGRVSTMNLRELVGSVKLAQFGSFADGGRALGTDLKIRICDPIYYLFMTSGILTRDAEILAEASGVIALDGDSMADILAGAKVGVRSERFDASAAMEWLQYYLSGPS